MKRSIYVILGAFCLSVVFRAAPVRAQDDQQAQPAEKGEGHKQHKEHKDKKEHKKEEEMHKRMAEFFKDKLGLSEEQVKKVEAVHKSHMESAKAAHQELAKAIRKLHGEVLIEASDSDISSALEAVQSAEKAEREQGEKMRSEIDGILNPTQRAKMLLMHHAMMHGRMAMGRGRGGEAWGHRPGEREEDEKSGHRWGREDKDGGGHEGWSGGHDEQIDAPADEDGD